MKKKKQNKKRSILFTLITLILITIACLAFNIKTNIENNEKSNIEKIVIVTKGEFKKIIETTGEVVPNLEVEIKCKASGEIIELPHDISDSVKTGDLLMRLDPEDEETSVKQAEVSLAISQAEYEQSKVNLDLAIQNLEESEIRAKAALSLAKAQEEEYKSKYNRAKTLNKKSIISDELFETAYTEYVNACTSVKNAEADIKNLDSLESYIEIMKQNIKIARANVESSKLTLKEAEQGLKDVTVTSPINGVVSEQDVQTGQIIASGVDNVDGGTTIMTISDLSKIFVMASVDESDIGLIQKGQNAAITVDAYPDLTFPGKIIRIATTGTTESSVVTYEVKIEVLGKNFHLLKPGMSADIKIVVLEKDNIITVPTASVSRKLSKQYVTVKTKNGQKSEQLVKTGESNGEQVEIIDGINEGDVILILNNIASKWTNTAGTKKHMPPGGPGPMGGMRL